MLKELSVLNRGDEFLIGEKHFIVLSKKASGVECVMSTLLPSSMRFSDTNCDFGKGSLCKYLNSSFLTDLVASQRGTSLTKNDFIEHTVDQTTLDGQTRYGFSEAKVSLMTFDMYRKHKRILPRVTNYWWLATPWCDHDDWSRCVCIVNSGGGLYYSRCDNEYGVRPFCILKSSILVSTNS